MLMYKCILLHEVDILVMKGPKCDHFYLEIVYPFCFFILGRGMNAAFAIGRLCDMESGRRHMLMLKKSDQMVFLFTFACVTICGELQT